MKRKPPKPKTPKSPKTTTGQKVDLRHVLGWPIRRGEALGLPGCAPAPGQVRPRFNLTSLPTPEWLVETACRLMEGPSGLTAAPANLFEIFYRTGTAGTRIRKQLLTFAYHFHKDAKHTIYIEEGGTPMPAFFSPEEIRTNSVDYKRGCLLITGLTKWQQAAERYEAVKKKLRGFAHEEATRADGCFLPHAILLGMVAYENFSKKPIDLEKSQYAPHPGHNAKPARQKRKRRGPTRFRRGQK